MANALITTIITTAFICGVWFGVFQYIDEGTAFFYFMLLLPNILVILALAFDSNERARQRNFWFKEMKRLEIQDELHQELWSWLPSETREKWFRESSKLIDIYNKKLDAWREP